jgi:hypothetical protein
MMMMITQHCLITADTGAEEPEHPPKTATNCRVIQDARGVRVWVVYLTPKIERIIVLLSASPEGEARLPMPKGMAYKE